MPDPVDILNILAILRDRFEHHPHRHPGIT
jgi:hypothetical protein